MPIFTRRAVAILLPALGVLVALAGPLWSPPIWHAASRVSFLAVDPDGSAPPTPEVLWSTAGRDAIRNVVAGRLDAESAGPVVEAFLSHLDWSPVGPPSMFDLKFDAADPALAVQGAGSAALALEHLCNRSGQDSQALRDRRSALQTELRTLAAGEEDNPGFLEERRRAAEKAVAALGEQYARARSVRLDLEARWSALRQSGGADPAEWFDSPELASLREERAALEQRRDQLATRFGPQWPEMREVTARLAAVQQRLSTEATRLAEEAARATEGDYRQALAQERALERSLGAQKQEIQTLRERETADEGRRGERGRLEAELASVGERLDSVAAAPGAQARVQIIQPASAAEARRGLPLSARLAAGVLIGLALGMAVRRAAEKLDPALIHAPAAESALGAPILSVLPEVPGGLPPGLLRLESAPPPGAEGPIDPLAAVARGLRDLRTGLLLARGGEPARMLLVTACRRGEGKTTVAVHLALALARRGARVLLIDGHPQRPRAHRLFGAPNGPGLIDVLTGTVKLEEAVRATDESGLFLMPAGDATGGGAERLDAASLRHLRDRLLQPGRFQHLVIDAGDVGSQAAPERLVVACSGILVVMRAGRNSRSAVRQAAATLRRHGAPHLAGVWIGQEEPARASRAFEPAAEPLPEAGPFADQGAAALPSETDGSPALTSDVMRRLELLRDRLGRPRQSR